jgi:hypothetical protein
MNAGLSFCKSLHTRATSGEIFEIFDNLIREENIDFSQFVGNGTSGAQDDAVELWLVWNLYHQKQDVITAASTGSHLQVRKFPLS